MDLNFSTSLRRFRWQAQKTSFPCQFYPLEERLHEQEARRCRRRGRACRPAGAQAQTANVTLYGRLNLDDGSRQRARRESIRNLPRQRQSANPNHLSRELELVAPRRARHRVAGRRPERDLPDRDRSISADSSGGTLAGRETFVGLQGGWGTFKMGYFLTPYDDIHPIFGNVPTLTTSILSTAALWAQGSPGDERPAASTTASRNSIRYDSPNMAGFNVEVQYGAQGDTDAQPGTTIRRRTRRTPASSAPARSTTTARSARASPTPATRRARSTGCRRRAPTTAANHDVRGSNAERLRDLGRGRLQLRRSSGSAACTSAWSTTMPGRRAVT